MKKLLPILLTLFFTGALFGQTPQADPYQEQYVSLYKVYSQNPDDVANLISMAEFFSDPVNPQFNLPLAYSYIKRAEEVYTQAVQDKKRYREVQKLIRAGVSITTLRQSKRDIEAQAVMYVRNHLGQMRSFEVAAYLEAFSENKELTRQLRSKMQSDAFALVKEENTINGYYSFSQQYPHTPQADSAETFLSKLAPRYFSSFTTEEPIDSVAALYPNSKALQNAAMRHGEHARACGGERGELAVNEIAHARRDCLERFRAVTGHVAGRILEAGADVVVHKKPLAVARSLVGPERNLAQPFVRHRLHAESSADYLRSVHGAAVGTGENAVKGQPPREHAAQRRLGEAHALIREVGPRRGALNAPLAVPLRLAMSEEINLHFAFFSSFAGLQPQTS